MRIAICVNSAWNVLNFRMGLVRALRAAGHEVWVIAPPGRDSNALRALGLEVHDWRLAQHGTNPWAEWQSLWRLWHLVRDKSPDAVLSFTIKPNLYAGLVCRWLGIPLLANVTGLGAAFQKGRLWAGLVKGLYRVALGRAHRVLFQNRDDQRVFLDQAVIEAAQAMLLPGSGVDLTRFAFQPMVALGQGDEFRFLMVARLLREKGVVEYVQAAGQLKARGVAARFQLLGDASPSNPSAVELTWVQEHEQAGYVEYLGSTEDVRPFLTQAHVVVLPSYREGTPRSLLEAMATGRALVASDVPGCRDVVTPGVNGYLCQPMQEESLAEAMLAMVNLPFHAVEQMGVASRKRVEAEYDEKLVISAYQLAISQIAK